jgi:NADH dehydrogenase
MKKTIAILGGGYGGLMTAIKLEGKTKSRDDLEIVLVDKNDYHQYVHLAYEIVTDVKKVSDLTLPMTELLEKRKVRFVKAIVKEIDLQNRVVKTDKDDISYHELVIALGNEPNFYNIKGAEEFSLSFNSVESAAKIRDKLKEIFQKTENPNIVVGGGGFTGVELAGEIVDECNCCVTIIEGSDKLLPSWNQLEFSEKVATVLTDTGAKLVLGKLVTEVKPDSITLKDGSQMPTSVFIWTAGVQASSLVKNSGLKTGKGNRAVINEFCEAVGFPGVYVVGDSALVADPDTGAILPQCIEVALQTAEIAADNLVADLEGSEKKTYHPKFSGLILAVGERYGIGKVFGRTVEGRVAQMLKRLVHLHYVYEIAGVREAIRESL